MIFSTFDVRSLKSLDNGRWTSHGLNSRFHRQLQCAGSRRRGQRCVTKASALGRLRLEARDDIFQLHMDIAYGGSPSLSVVFRRTDPLARPDSDRQTL